VWYAIARSLMSDTASAMLPGRKVAFGQGQPVAAHAVEVLLSQSKAGDGGRPIHPRLTITAMSRDAGLTLACRGAAIAVGRSEVDDEVGRAHLRLPRDNHRFLARLQAASRSWLQVGQCRKQREARSIERDWRRKQATRDRTQCQDGHAAGGSQKIPASNH
jgi:hypothetical protein